MKHAKGSKPLWDFLTTVADTIDAGKRTADSTLNLGVVVKSKGDAFLRVATFLIVGWFGALIGFALLPIEAMQQLLVALPFIAMLMLWLKEPSIIFGGLVWDKTSDLFKRMISVVAYQEVLGLVLWFLPIHNKRDLVVPFIAVLLTIGLFKISGKKSALVTFLWIAAGVMALMFFASGVKLPRSANAQTGQVQQVAYAQAQQNYAAAITGTTQARVVISPTPQPVTPTANTFPVEDPSLSIWAEPNPYITTPGSLVRLTVVIGNHGAGDAKNPMVTVELPQGLVFAETGTQVQTWTIEDIDKNVGERSVSATIQVARETVPGGYDLVVRVNADNLPQEFSVSRSIVVNS